MLSTLTLGKGQTNGTGTNPGVGVMSFSAGTVNVTTVVMGSTSGTNGTAQGTLNVDGGLLLVGTGGIALGSQASTAVGSGTLNIAGGLVSMGAAIVSSSGAGTLTLDGGTLNMGGFAIGGTASANQIQTLNFQSGTLLNVAEINGGAAALVKSTTGTLVLTGTNTFTGGLRVADGTAILTNSGAVADGESLTVGDASFFPAPVIPAAPVPAASAAAAVPEPGTAALLAMLLAGAAVCLRGTGAARRRKQP
jgi:autotransporter-associated beta strand protein